MDETSDLASQDSIFLVCVAYGLYVWFVIQFFVDCYLIFILDVRVEICLDVRINILVFLFLMLALMFTQTF